MSGVNYIFVSDLVEKQGKKSTYITLPFYKNGKPLNENRNKKWGMTLLSALSMRFRWNEKNDRRTETLNQIVREVRPAVCSGACGSDAVKCDCKHSVVSLELIHSKIVYDIKEADDTKDLKGDGMITENPLLVPVVTVADCVPLFFYDDVKGVFGCVHSGWKGTGIIGEAIKKAVNEYGSKIEDICVAIGPHIGNCCYFVDEQRAEYFTSNFGNCVKVMEDAAGGAAGAAGKKYMLSLTDANLDVIRKCGVKNENIVVARDCTCCTTFSDKTNVFGSFRRQAAFLPPEVDADTRSRSMTVQAAFVI